MRPRKNIVSHFNRVRKHEAAFANGAAFRSGKRYLNSRFTVGERLAAHHATVKARTKARKGKRFQHERRAYGKAAIRIGPIAMGKSRRSKIVYARSLQIWLRQTHEQIYNGRRRGRTFHAFTNSQMGIDQARFFHDIEAFAANEQKVNFGENLKPASK